MIMNRGRKKSRNATISKTYRFFEEDIDKMLTMGCTPKEIFRLGIYAKENNPQMISRVSEIETTNEQLATKLQSTSRKLYDLQMQLKEKKNK